MRTSGPVKTLNSSLTDAEICRRNGWRRGTKLIGLENGVAAVIQITAVGDDNILAKELDGDEYEGDWTLIDRQWKKLPRSVRPKP